MPHGGNFSAVGGFRFMAVTTLAEAVKRKYGCIFSAVSGFSFFGGNDVGGGGKPKIYGVKFSVISCFSFFGVNVNGASKLGGNCPA